MFVLYANYSKLKLAIGEVGHQWSSCVSGQGWSVTLQSVTIIMFVGLNLIAWTQVRTGGTVVSGLIAAKRPACDRCLLSCTQGFQVKLLPGGVR